MTIVLIIVFVYVTHCVVTTVLSTNVAVYDLSFCVLQDSILVKKKSSLMVMLIFDNIAHQLLVSFPRPFKLIGAGVEKTAWAPLYAHAQDNS